MNLKDLANIWMQKCCQHSNVLPHISQARLVEEERLMTTPLKGNSLCQLRRRHGPWHICGSLFRLLWLLLAPFAAWLWRTNKQTPCFRGHRARIQPKVRNGQHGPLPTIPSAGLTRLRLRAPARAVSAPLARAGPPHASSTCPPRRCTARLAAGRRRPTGILSAERATTWAVTAGTSLCWPSDVQAAYKSNGQSPYPMQTAAQSKDQYVQDSE